MTAVRVVYTDKWGDILDRPDEDCLEIRWFDTTAIMNGDDFNTFLTRYAEHVEAWRRGGGLVDSVQFKMDISKMQRGWRDKHIVPRYNAAGLRKFAFVMPQGMPTIGTPPKQEGPAQYLTAYFGTRIEALAWLRA